jgi:polyisoprenoid-binding protein YceI
MRAHLIAAVAVAALTSCVKAPTASAPPPAGTAASPTTTGAAAVPEAAPAVAPASTAPGGAYTADPAHTSVNFRIGHMGLSNFTARFTRIDAHLTFDPAHPEASSVEATIDPATLQTNYPDPKKLNFDAQIEREFLEAAKFPAITFKSTKVEKTGPATAKITGDLTLHGVTRPVVLDATFNGGYAAGGMDPSGARVGFSAHGVIRRSDYGIKYGLPAPGTNMGVSDPIEVAIEAEFTQPAH